MPVYIYKKIKYKPYIHVSVNYTYMNNTYMNISMSIIYPHTYMNKFTFPIPKFPKQNQANINNHILTFRYPFFTQL